MNSFNDKLIQLATRVGDLLAVGKLSITTAESCTGGWLAHVLTSLPTSSPWFERGFVTYSDDSKIELLQVPLSLLNEFGAVSKEVAVAMAKGALIKSKAQVAISITGLAGPDKDRESSTKIGTCWICWSIQNSPIEVHCRLFEGDRANVNYQAVEFSLSHLIKMLKNWN